MRWRVRAGYFVAVVFLILAAPTPHSILWGGIVAAIGLAIRGAAAGYLRKYAELATTGPYAHTRNPLYLGSAFLAGGFAVAGHSWWAGAIIVLYFAIFYAAVMRNEENDLRARFGEVFDQYAAEVPLFFPRIAAGTAQALPEGRRTEGFCWPQYRRNREYKALLGALGGLGILWLRMWLRMRLGL